MNKLSEQTSMHAGKLWCCLLIACRTNDLQQLMPALLSRSCCMPIAATALAGYLWTLSCPLQWSKPYSWTVNALCLKYARGNFLAYGASSNMNKESGLKTENWGGVHRVLTPCLFGVLMKSSLGFEKQPSIVYSSTSRLTERFGLLSYTPLV